MKYLHIPQQIKPHDACHCGGCLEEPVVGEYFCLLCLEYDCENDKECKVIDRMYFDEADLNATIFECEEE